MPPWCSSLDCGLIYEQAKANVESKIAEVKTAMTQGDVPSKLARSVVLAVRLLVDATGILADILEYLIRLRESDFTSDEDLTALLELTRRIRKLRDKQVETARNLDFAQGFLKTIKYD